jgi:CRP-like cAMP-binding protein
MDDMDFTKPQPGSPEDSAASAPFKTARSPFYDSALAARLFKAAGTAETFEAGKTLFVESQKAASGGLFSRGAQGRMYFIAEGEVSLSIGGRALDTIRAGEVVGEMAVISGEPRSATAVAKTRCSVWSVSAEELQAALAKEPEFALMLMSAMFDRLRFATARLMARKVPIAPRKTGDTVFDAALLAKLEESLPHAALVRYPREAIVMREGQKGACMYAVKSGRVAIYVRDKAVEAVGPGGTFGEMALVDMSPRAATAMAVVETELLSIDRAVLASAITRYPAFAMAMMRSVADRLRHVTAQLA